MSRDWRRGAAPRGEADGAIKPIAQSTCRLIDGPPPRSVLGVCPSVSGGTLRREFQTTVLQSDSSSSQLRESGTGRVAPGTRQTSRLSSPALESVVVNQSQQA